MLWQAFARDYHPQAVCHTSVSTITSLWEVEQLDAIWVSSVLWDHSWCVCITNWINSLQIVWGQPGVSVASWSRRWMFNCRKRYIYFVRPETFKNSYENRTWAEHKLQNSHMASQHNVFQASPSPFQTRIRLTQVSVLYALPSILSVCICWQWSRLFVLGQRRRLQLLEQVVRVPRLGTPWSAAPMHRINKVGFMNLLTGEARLPVFKLFWYFLPLVYGILFSVDSLILNEQTTVPTSKFQRNEQVTIISTSPQNERLIRYAPLRLYFTFIPNDILFLQIFCWSLFKHWAGVK